MSWKDVEPHTAKRVEWEYWSNSNDECGFKCERQRDFVRDFGPTAEMLEQKGYTRFTPHYITLGCPSEYQTSDFCNAQCINKGRYCEQDPDGDLRSGFSGKDVVEQNLRQLCGYKWADGAGKPWLWWRYAAANGEKCSMAANKYSMDCLRQVEADLLVDSAAVRTIPVRTPTRAPARPNSSIAHRSPPGAGRLIQHPERASAPLVSCRLTAAWETQRPTPQTLCSRRSAKGCSPTAAAGT